MLKLHKHGRLRDRTFLVRGGEKGQERRVKKSTNCHRAGGKEKAFARISCTPDTKRNFGKVKRKKETSSEEKNAQNPVVGSNFDNQGDDGRKGTNK